MRRLGWVGVVAASLALATGCGGKASSAAKTTTTTGTASSSTTVPTFTGSSSSAYCQLVQKNPPTANVLSDPQLAFTQFDAFADKFLSVVPAVIKADAQTLVSGLQKVEQAFKAVNYVTKNLNPAALSVVDTPGFIAAIDRVGAYDSQVCGLTTSTT